MPRYAVFGAGMMGRVVAQDLLASEADASVALFDRRDELLAPARDAIADSRLTTSAVDAKDGEAVARAMKGHDVAISALPHGLSLGLVESAIASGTSLVDLVGEAPEKRRALDAEARRTGALIVPGCGVAPGISNFCVGRGIELLDETQKAVISSAVSRENPSRRCGIRRCSCSRACSRRTGAERPSGAMGAGSRSSR